MQRMLLLDACLVYSGNKLRPLLQNSKSSVNTSSICLLEYGRMVPAPQSKSKRSVLAPKMVPFGWVKYSTILGASVAHLEWSRFDPNKQGRNSTLLKGQNEEAKGMFWKNTG